MNKENKKYKVSILGESYSIVSDEDQNLITQAAQLVDLRMEEIDQLAVISEPKKIAVLAALQIASELVRLKAQADQAKLHQKALVDIIDQALSPTALD